MELHVEQVIKVVAAQIKTRNVVDQMKPVSKICIVLQMETSYVVMAHNACKINNAAEIIVVKKMKFVMANNAKKLYLYN